MLMGLPQLIKYRLGFDVRIGYPNQYLVSASDEKLSQPLYATSVGLIVEGSALGPTLMGRTGFVLWGGNSQSPLKENIFKNLFSDEGSRF
jgi:cell division ATPase FtsA